MGEHSCSLGKRGGFLERLIEGTWLGHVAEHVALELQRESGAHIYRGKTRGAGSPGTYNVIYGYGEEQVGLEAGRLAVRLVNHLVKAEPGFDFHAELERLILLAERRAFGPVHAGDPRRGREPRHPVDPAERAVAGAARAGQVPAADPGDDDVEDVGARRRHRRATRSSRTSCWRPPACRSREAEMVRTEDEAVEGAKRIGFPVVTKPLDGNHGRGVGLDLKNERAVRTGFKRAVRRVPATSVVVESFVTGNDYRVLVVGGRMVAVAQRVPAHVVGDGKHTVRRAGRAHERRPPPRHRPREGPHAGSRSTTRPRSLVKKQGYATGRRSRRRATIVKLAATGNMSTGGISIDRTWEAHEENIEIAEEAARVVGLDVAGIDFITPDISQPVRETGGAIVEVNAAPGFRMHTHPTEGEPQYVAKPVIDLLFPPGTPARIPIVAVTGSNGKTTTVRMIAHIFKGMGRKVGMTSTDGIYIDERLVKRVDASGPKSAQMVLQNPRVDFAVFEVARGGILREGLGYGRNDVAVVLNVTGDHLGLKEVDTIEQLAAVKRVVVEAVPRNGTAVLNADDPLVLEMRRHCSGTVILFTMQEDNELVERWVRRGQQGGRARAGSARRDDGDPRGAPDDADRLGAHAAGDVRGPRPDDGAERDGRRRGRARRRRAPARHPPGAAVVHDVDLPGAGRLNLFELNGVKVLIDYAHNAAGLETVGDFVERMTSGAAPSAGTARRGVVVGEPPGGRHRDPRGPAGRGHARARPRGRQVLRRDHHPRGRAPAGRARGETAAQILEGVQEAMRAAGASGTSRSSWTRWTPRAGALDRSRPGDLVVLCVDYATEVWKELETRRGAAPQVLPAPEGDGQIEAIGGDPDLGDPIPDERSRRSRGDTLRGVPGRDTAR